MHTTSKSTSPELDNSIYYSAISNQQQQQSKLIKHKCLNTKPHPKLMYSPLMSFEQSINTQDQIDDIHQHSKSHRNPFKKCCWCCRRKSKHKESLEGSRFDIKEKDSIHTNTTTAYEHTSSRSSTSIPPNDRIPSGPHLYKKTPSNTTINKPGPSSRIYEIPNTGIVVTVTARNRRQRIPDRPNKTVNLWTILKSGLTSDITRTPLPVNFSEPLSFLQRLAEDYEYSILLDNAAHCSDPLEQLCLIAAFAIATYSSTGVRTWKPFNPLEGETFEWDRMDDLGWRYIAEQVSHHPPISATHCEGKNGWICFQDLSLTSNWHMNTCDFTPIGLTHVKLSANGSWYSWGKVTTCVHGIVVGKIWVDQLGETVITNHTTKDTCKIRFLPGGKLSHQVAGTVFNSSMQGMYSLNGTWDGSVTATSLPQNSTNQLTPPNRQLLWRKNPHDPLWDKYYSMSPFACQLNELEYGVAPTDSRLRPDQRLTEEGLWDKANSEKLRVESKQRSQIKTVDSTNKSTKTEATGNSSSSKGIHKPLWFFKEIDPITALSSYVFNGKYWDQKKKKDWSMCPDIF